MATVIVIANKKGGVGKSTTTINLAYILAQKHGKRVLIMDADPQCNATSLFSKVNSQGKSLEDIIVRKRNAGSCIRRSRYKNLDIIKGSLTLAEWQVIDIDWMKRVKEELKGAYDIILVDTRPSFEALTESAIAAADMVLTPMELDKFCKDNLGEVEAFLNSYIEQGLIWKVFFNSCRFRQKGQREIFEELMSRHCYPILNTCVGDCAAIGTALDRNKPVVTHRSKSAGAMDYMELAEELLAVIESEV